MEKKSVLYSYFKACLPACFFFNTHFNWMYSINALDLEVVVRGGRNDAGAPTQV